MKKALSIALTVILIINVFSCSLVLQASNCSWKFVSVNILYNESEETLYISGSGKMINFSSMEPPWQGLAIKNVFIANGITSIGTNGFKNCNIKGTVSIPRTVESIGNNAFYNNDNMEILCSLYSYAHVFAAQNSIPFKFIGDVSFDYALDSFDLTTMVYDLLTNDINDMLLSDVNKDGIFNVVDFILLKRELIYLEENPDAPSGLTEIGETAPSTLSTDWEKETLPVKDNSSAEATALRNSVLKSENTEKLYTITGTKYYVSPKGKDTNNGLSSQTAIATVSAVNQLSGRLKPGDAVLFERGGLWRLSSAFKCVNGVTYGSYGVGEKPTFYGSRQNYASDSLWTPSRKKYVWKLSLADKDVGQVVCDSGTLVGNKQLNGLVTLQENGDYYYNKSDELLYFYLDEGNPGIVFDDIEIPVVDDGFDVDRAQNVVIDNIRLKYVGKHGIDLCDCNGSKITNCEIGFIGGSIQSGTLRYGNGIQVWNGVNGHTVENCWIYQVYDAALTFQGDNSYKEGFLRDVANNDLYKNITYKNNLIEYCTYSFEFWHANTEMDGTEHDTLTIARFENINITENISRFVGYGWGSQRPDHMGNHILVWRRALPNSINNSITNNIFDMADGFIVYWMFKDSDANNNGEWNISNNTYFHGKNSFSECINYQYMSYAYNANDFNNCLKRFESSPKAVNWVD